MVEANSTTRRPVQVAATVVAAVFLLVGILGFVPGVRAHAVNGKAGVA